MPLEKPEKEAIELLAEGLREHFGPELIQLFLFGSKARGDDRPNSDVDVLVVLKDAFDTAVRFVDAAKKHLRS